MCTRIELAIARKKGTTVGEVNDGARAVEVGILVRKEWKSLPYTKSQHLLREHLPREIAFTRCTVARDRACVPCRTNCVRCTVHFTSKPRSGVS